MPVTIVATPGASNANSFLIEAEAAAYFNARLPLVPPWEDADDPTAALVMATRVLSALAQPYRSLMGGGPPYYYRVRRRWTGAPSTTTQSLPWPRTGMFDANGNAIASNVIPQALKDATAELAGQLIVADTTLDNTTAVKGITSVKAGSVSVSFKDMVESKVLPDAVWNLMPPSWFTDETIEGAVSALFDVVSS
jgi:hypothetical protein